MFTTLDEDTLQYRPRLKKCGSVCTVLSVTLCFVTLIMLLAIFAVDLNQKVHVVYIDGVKPRFVTNEKFLSVALDSATIASGFKHFDFTNERLLKVMKALSPAYLRVGGTMADRLIFTTNKSMSFKYHLRETDGGECSYEQKYCDYLQKPNFTMNAKEWIQLNKLAQKTNLDLIFDLNVLQRFDNNTWDPTNAEELISFSNKHNFNLNWELGNEPNSFRHQFNYQVDGSQLAKDFNTLRNLLRKYPKYADSLLVGPDVTRPRTDSNQSTAYLREFLTEGGHVVDAVTWHQYYFNGATAKVGDFLDPQTFDILKWQINAVKAIVQGDRLTDKRIWLGETSSAYGGGALHLSNRYVATFIWLDKLGVAAQYGLDVVIRQTIFQGHYALVNKHYEPSPDWWVSVLYKKLVGNKVVDCHTTHSPKTRIYCQCTQPKSYYKNISSVTVFGINLHNRIAKIRFEGTTPLNDELAMKDLKVHAYVLTTVERIDSRLIFLNDDLLELTNTNDVPNLLPRTVSAHPYVEMPPYSLAFWVVPATGNVPYYF
jgi:heparanase 1